MLQSSAMRKIIFLAGVLILVLVTASYGKGKPRKDFTILTVKKQTVYLKVNKSFLGGKVEVYDDCENLLEGEDLPHTHTMLYFEEIPRGVYIIKVKKGKRCTQFKYNNI